MRSVQTVYIQFHKHHMQLDEPKTEWEYWWLVGRDGACPILVKWTLNCMQSMDMKIQFCEALIRSLSFPSLSIYTAKRNPTLHKNSHTHNMANVVKWNLHLPLKCSPSPNRRTFWIFYSSSWCQTFPTFRSYSFRFWWWFPRRHCCRPVRHSTTQHESAEGKRNQKIYYYVFAKKNGIKIIKVEIRIAGVDRNQPARERIIIIWMQNNNKNADRKIDYYAEQ